MRSVNPTAGHEEGPWNTLEWALNVSGARVRGTRPPLSAVMTGREGGREGCCRRGKDWVKLGEGGSKGNGVVERKEGGLLGGGGREKEERYFLKEEWLGRGGSIGGKVGEKGWRTV